MREGILFSILLALMEITGNCVELPGTTLMEQNFGANVTMLSTVFSLDDNHSISKRDTKDSVINALTIASNSLALAAAVSFEVPVAAAAFGLLSSVAQMGILFITAVTSAKDKIAGSSLSKGELLKRIRADTADYDVSVEQNFQIIKGAIENLNLNLEVVSKRSFFYKEYQLLNQAFFAYFDKPKGTNVKKNLVTAADDLIIMDIINGIGAYIFDQTFYNQSISDGKFNSEVFAAWTSDIRAYLYQTIIMKAFVIGLEKKKNQKITVNSITAALQWHVDEATHILERMGKIGRELYWELDVEDNIRKEMKNWYTDDFQGSFGKAMSKYHKFKEQHMVVAVTSEDVNMIPYCGGNSKHDVQNLMPNAILNTKVIHIHENIGIRPFDNKCMTVYVIRIPPTRITSTQRRAPNYVKYIGEKYGDAVRQRADLDKLPSRINTNDYQYQSIDKNMFPSVLQAAVNKEHGGPVMCYFDLARFRFEPSRYNNLIVWPHYHYPYGFVSEKFFVPYTYKNRAYYIDTFSLC